MMLPSGNAWADETGAGDVAGSYRIQIQSGGDYADCSTVHRDDVVTVSQVGSNDLELTLPSGESWQLTPTERGTVPGTLASWKGSGDVRTLDFHGPEIGHPRGNTDTISIGGQFGCQDGFTAWRVGGPTALVKDPKTNTWVIWVLVPVAGGLIWVIYKVAKKAGTNSNKNDRRKQYWLDVGTQDNRLALNADGEDELWVYAQVRCNQPEVDTAAITSALTFTVEGVDAGWLMLGPPVMANGFKTLPVRARPPRPDAQPPEVDVPVVVWTTLEGQPLTGRVPLTLQVFALRIY